MMVMMMVMESLLQQQLLEAGLVSFSEPRCSGGYPRLLMALCELQFDVGCETEPKPLRSQISQSKKRRRAPKWQKVCVTNKGPPSAKETGEHVLFSP